MTGGTKIRFECLSTFYEHSLFRGTGVAQNINLFTVVICTIVSQIFVQVEYLRTRMLLIPMEHFSELHKLASDVGTEVEHSNTDPEVGGSNPVSGEEIQSDHTVCRCC